MSGGLPDYLGPNLRAVICGTAVGLTSKQRGGYYAGAGNEFWKYMYASGLTAHLLGPESDRRVLEFGIGLTDLVKDRAASSDAGLEGYDVPAFLRKVRRHRPRWIAFNGKTAATHVSRHLGEGRSISLGRQNWTIEGMPVFVLPSTSGANRSLANLEGRRSRLAWFKTFAREVERVEPQVTDA